LTELYSPIQATICTNLQWRYKTKILQQNYP